jgi:uncharacterized membrane protein YfcA
MSAVPPLEFFALYAALGVLVGVLAGLLGVGGGIIIVPALAVFFHAQNFAPEILMHLALATSLASIVFTSMSSARAHHRHGAVLWPVVLRLSPGIVVGAGAGALVVDTLSSEALRVTFGIFACLVAWQTARGSRPQPQRDIPGSPGLWLAGGAIGSVSTLVGIGGGSLTVPFLLWCNVGIHRAVATSSACALPIALAGSAAMMLAGWKAPNLPPGATGYVYWPAALIIAATSVLAAPWGAGLSHALPVAVLRRIFAVFLVLVGVRMLF